MSKPAAKPAAEGEVVAPKSKKKLFIIIGVAVALLGTGGAAAWHFMAPHDASKKEAEHKPALPPVFLNIERFTVNLQPDGSEQYLQAEIVVQVKNEETVELLKLHMPQVRSRLLMLLSSKTAEDISTMEGKNKLLGDMVVQLKLPFSKGEKPQEIDSVLFTDFVIQ
jgi:flagellar FliL protein